MASVPAETNASNMPAAREGDAPESRSDLFMGFNRLNLLRQIGLLGVVFFSITGTHAAGETGMHLLGATLVG